MKQLWSLKAIDTTYDEEVLIIASSQEEADNRWDDLFGDGSYLGGAVQVVDVIENHEVIVREIIEEDTRETYYT